MGAEGEREPALMGVMCLENSGVTLELRPCFGEGPKVRHQCNPHGTNGAYTYSAICERK